jgi:hypothetical protein
MDTGTYRALNRAHAAGIETLRRERAERAEANRLRYGTRADVEAGVADVLERRRTVRVVPS